MRRWAAIAMALLAGTAFVGAQGAGGKVEVKGPHICCKQCVNVATGILGKVAGVSDAAADAKTKTVTFTAKDDAAAKAGLQALIDGGFFGSATVEGKELKASVPAPARGAKAEVVTVKDVHVCCKACQNAVNKLFKDAKVTYEGPGPKRTVRIEGAGLDAGAVVEALRGAGFNGTAEK